MEYEFDRDSGRYARRFIRAAARRGRVSGNGAVERTAEYGPMFFCVYRWDGDFLFQAGQRRWSLTRSDLTLAFKSRGASASEFRVIEEGVETFRCSYTHRLRNLWAAFDPTYDGLDFESDHFLAYVASLSLPVNAPGWLEWVDEKP